MFNVWHKVLTYLNLRENEGEGKVAVTKQIFKTGTALYKQHITNNF